MAFWNRKKAPEKAQLERVEEPVERSEFRSTAGRSHHRGERLERLPVAEALQVQWD
jgi:hypothetical protein